MKTDKALKNRNIESNYIDNEKEYAICEFRFTCNAVFTFLEYLNHTFIQCIYSRKDYQHYFFEISFDKDTDEIVIRCEEKFSFDVFQRLRKLDVTFTQQRFTLIIESKKTYDKKVYSI